MEEGVGVEKNLKKFLDDFFKKILEKILLSHRRII